MPEFKQLGIISKKPLSEEILILEIHKGNFLTL